MTMNVAGFVPKIWSTKIIRTLEDNLVAKKICNTEHQGEIKKAGDSVHFNGLADPTIGTYGSSDISYENLEDAGLTMVIDQQKYFAFQVDDIEKAQANVDLKGSQAARAAYKLKETADTFILSKHVDALHTVDGQSTAISTAIILSKMGEIQQKLAEQNISESDMFVVIPPWVRLKMQLAGIRFQINEGLNGTGGMAWTSELGFKVFVSNNVVAHSASTATVPRHYVLGGAFNAIAYADQILETEAIRLEKRFKSAIRGLHVYGGKTIRPDHLVSADFKFAAETAI